MVWDFRALACEYWLTPDPRSALKYAYTESGEAIDALLRDERPDDKRNRQKDAERLDEWADCAIMLLTFLPSGANHFPLEKEWVATDEQLCFRVASHLNARGDIAETVSVIGLLPGMDLRVRMVERLRRIMYKHVPAWKWGEFTAVLGEGLTTSEAP